MLKQNLNSVRKGSFVLVALVGASVMLPACGPKNVRIGALGKSLNVKKGGPDSKNPGVGAPSGVTPAPKTPGPVAGADLKLSGDFSLSKRGCKDNGAAATGFSGAPSGYSATLSIYETSAKLSASNDSGCSFVIEAGISKADSGSVTLSNSTIFWYNHGEPEATMPGGSICDNLEDLTNIGDTIDYTVDSTTLTIDTRLNSKSCNDAQTDIDQFVRAQ